MAVGAFPLAKLGFLVIKQISKPIANSLARRAKQSRIFREYVCIPTAQLFHWYDVKVRMRMLNLGRATAIPKLNEAKAIETGAQLLSEMFILGVGTGILLLEYFRQAEKEDAKQDQIEREKAFLNDKVEELEFRLERQAVDVKQLTRLTYALQDELKKGTLKGWFKRNGPKEETEEEPAVPTKLVAFKSPPPMMPDVVPLQEDSAITGAVIDLLGPVSEGVVGPEALRGSFSPYQDPSPSSSEYQPGAVTDAVDYFLSGCRDDED